MASTRHVLGSVVLALVSFGAVSASGQTMPLPRVVVVTKLRSPDFVMRKSGLLSGQKQVVPLVDYDFAAALTAEVVGVLSENKRATWRVATTEEEPLLSPAFTGKDIPGLPESVAADRVLAIYVVEYGGWSYPMHGKKFILSATILYYERASGRKRWVKGYYERIDMRGSLEKAEEDSQKGMKEALNKLIEKFAEKVGKHVANADL